MPQNRIHSLVPDALLSLARGIVSGIEAASSGAYPVSPAAVENLVAEADALASANTAVIDARAAYRAAIQARMVQARLCAERTSGVAAQIYASPDVTPGMVSALGLSPHSTARTRIVPHTPLGLTATPLPTGEIVLRWNRSGNHPDVSYIVEAQVASGDWGFVEVVNGVRTTIRGYVPGAPVVFRVRASKNKKTTAPSNVAMPYATALRLAA